MLFLIRDWANAPWSFLNFFVGVSHLTNLTSIIFFYDFFPHLF
jgi:hypothetical protein